MAALFLVVAATPASRGASTVAPADEYFGHRKISVLGIKNGVIELAIRADRDPYGAALALDESRWLDDALREWARKYPRDRWLPRYAYALEWTYERIPGEEARRRATVTAAFVAHTFPATPYGRVAKAKLDRGIPRPAPLPTPNETKAERDALLSGATLPTTPPAATPRPSPTPGGWPPVTAE